MRVLICVSGNAPDYTFEKTQVFVYEQIEAVCKLDSAVEYQVFAVKGKGVKGYIKAFTDLTKAVRSYNPDVIHAHCGYVGALASLQRRVPVITTFHGTDINNKKMRPVSEFASLLSKYSIFVSHTLQDKMRIKGNDRAIIPCGVDRSIFHNRPAVECKRSLGIPDDERYILFASGFDNSIKNPELAKDVASHFPDFTLREIRNRSREEVARLINGAELVLMTSHSEGSPQIIKEAISCSQKVVSVDVGDVRDQLSGIKGCQICTNNEMALVDAIKGVLPLARPSAENDYRYDNTRIAEEILKIYYSILK